ncbi:glycosyltransferase family 87 protein [Bradyrhizobium sp. CB1717]|uniref:glycosyltransferase family 87 protein n=1 Tax=Bradyrhizobium sp. CB1717 TaxID=3039154 RepID=UPI0024B18F86|nr:glycosyltransferase family 87 protein [Bradyrhizobium sp. CB1717]WFU22570.1 glycosyltransferase family 87 protein [Bradyrhizobium sp. CB1717]
MTLTDPFPKPDAPRRLSLRAPLDLLFLLCCVILTADVLVPEIFGHGKTKDYGLWYWAGQQVLHGGPLYPADIHSYFEFIYPPLPAILLAIPSWFGKIPLYIVLSILNALAWWYTGTLSQAMTGSGRTAGPWLEALPAFVTVTFVFDMFDLGQPNLLLLAMMLYGFWSLQHQRAWLAGFMFALATAIKVFPIAVLPYLMWRRKWAAVAATVAFTGILLYVVPAPIRGFESNAAELKTWYQGMVGSSSEKGFGQRDEQNWSWVNQSLIAMTHRLVRPINYNQEDPNKPPRTMNVIDVDYKTANLIVLAVSALLGLGFVAVMPPRRRRTARSDAEELGILFCLMTVASPLARQYYFMWLFFPMTVLMHRAAFDVRANVRLGTWLALGAAGTLMLLALPWFPNVIQAWGNNLAATAILAGSLAWHMRHPPVAAGSEPATGLKPNNLEKPS